MTDIIGVNFFNAFLAGETTLKASNKNEKKKSVLATASFLKNGFLFFDWCLLYLSAFNKRQL